MGIVVTMGHIDGPPAEIGHKVGAALVGTFLGILMSYGFAAPLVARLDLAGTRRNGFLPHDRLDHRRIRRQLAAEGGHRPARRGVATEFRPNRNELDELFKEAEAA